MTAEEKNKQAMEIIEHYGGIDGDHHRAWCLDQIARILKGDDYESWVQEMLGDWDEEFGEYEYSYDKGIAP